MNNVAWYDYVKKSWPLLLCFPMGMAGTGNRILKYALLAVSAIAVSFYISSLLPWDTAYDGVYLAATFAMAAFMYMMGAGYRDVFSSMLTIAMVLIYLAELLIFRKADPEYLLPVKICAFISFVVALLNFNSLSLLNGVHNAKGGTFMPVPAGLRGRNAVLLVSFFVISLVFGNILPIGSSIAYVMKSILSGVWGLFMLIGGIGDADTAAPEPTPAESSSPDIINIDVPVNSFANVFVIIYIIIVLILFLLILYFLISGGPERLKGLLKSLKKRLKLVQPDMDYEEDIEKILSLRDLFKKRRRGLNDFLGKLFRKQVKFEDMPDNRMKVRFAFWLLLKKRGVTKSGTSLTPREIGSSLDASGLTKLAEDYCEARYNEISPVGDDAAQNAGAALAEINKIRIIKESGVDG